MLPGPTFSTCSNFVRVDVDLIRTTLDLAVDENPVNQSEATIVAGLICA